MEISGATNDDFQYKYSANIQVIPDDFCMTENYVEFASHFGTMQFGNVSGVESAFIEDATSLIGGTGVLTVLYGIFLTELPECLTWFI